MRHDTIVMLFEFLECFPSQHISIVNEKAIIDNDSHQTFKKMI